MDILLCAFFSLLPMEMNEAAAVRWVYKSGTVEIKEKWNVGVALETRWRGQSAAPTHSLTHLHIFQG